MDPSDQGHNLFSPLAGITEHWQVQFISTGHFNIVQYSIKHYQAIKMYIMQAYIHFYAVSIHYIHFAHACTNI